MIYMLSLVSGKIKMFKTNDGLIDKAVLNMMLLPF